jgi:transcription initiation factor TFIIE subunit alpha
MASTTPEAEAVHILLRRITRAFYNTRQIIAYDIVLKHAALRDIHLASLMNLTPKEIHKLVAPLISDCILQQHSKAEPKTQQELDRMKLGAPEPSERKPRQRTFYFVDYPTAVDAVKWRMVQLTTLLSKESQTYDSQYVCPRCGRRYSTLDAGSLLSPDMMSFICMDCGSILQEETNDGIDENGEEKAKYARLMLQVDPIVRAMKAVDDLHVPENTFTIAHANAIPPYDDEETTADYPNLAPTIAPITDIPTTTTTNQSFKIDFSEVKPGTSAEDIAKRTAQQEQNALPEWHMRSTVSGELTHAGSRQTEVQPEYLSFSRTAEEDEKKVKAVAKDAGTEDEIAAYYAAVRANAQQEIAQFEAEEAEFTDEDEGAWEESNIEGTGVSSAISTPAGSSAAIGESANGVIEPAKADDDDDEDEDEEFEDV